MGLTRAFMYAGTPALSVTLWSVESIPEKTLSTGLYKTLKADRGGRAAALRKIKLRMIRGAEDQTYRYSCS
jgi:CHAT domain-containing protein